MGSGVFKLNGGGGGVELQLPDVEIKAPFALKRGEAFTRAKVLPTYNASTSFNGVASFDNGGGSIAISTFNHVVVGMSTGLKIFTHTANGVALTAGALIITSGPVIRVAISPTNPTHLVADCRNNGGLILYTWNGTTYVKGPTILANNVANQTAFFLRDGRLLVNNFIYTWNGTTYIRSTVSVPFSTVFANNQPFSLKQHDDTGMMTYVVAKSMSIDAQLRIYDENSNGTFTLRQQFGLGYEIPSVGISPSGKNIVATVNNGSGSMDPYVHWFELDEETNMYVAKNNPGNTYGAIPIAFPSASTSYPATMGCIEFLSEDEFVTSTAYSISGYYSPVKVHKLSYLGNGQTTPYVTSYMDTVYAPSKGWNTLGYKKSKDYIFCATTSNNGASPLSICVINRPIEYKYSKNYSMYQSLEGYIGMPTYGDPGSPKGYMWPSRDVLIALEDKATNETIKCKQIKIIV